MLLQHFNPSALTRLYDCFRAFWTVLLLTFAWWLCTWLIDFFIYYYVRFLRKKTHKL